MADFDAIIIGTGQAGPSLAFRLAGARMKVAVVERHFVGGTSVNTGCTPTKALVASAYAARIARRAAECGVVLGGDIGIDMRRVRARTNAIVAASRNGLTSALENVANITLYRSHARFASPQLYLADRNILVDLPKDGIFAAFGTPFKDRGRRGRQKPGNVFRDLPGHLRGRAPARVAQVVFRRGFSTW